MARKKAAANRSFTSTGQVRAQPALPSISHLQFLVLHLLSNATADTPTAAISTEIAKFSADYCGPKFYQLMKRLTTAGFVTTQLHNLEVAGAVIKRSFYAITPKGRKAMNDTSAFYAALRPRTM